MKKLFGKKKRANREKKKMEPVSTENEEDALADDCDKIPFLSDEG